MGGVHVPERRPQPHDQLDEGTVPKASLLFPLQPHGLVVVMSHLFWGLFVVLLVAGFIFLVVYPAVVLASL